MKGWIVKKKKPLTLDLQFVLFVLLFGNLQLLSARGRASLTHLFCFLNLSHTSYLNDHTLRQEPIKKLTLSKMKTNQLDQTISASFLVWDVIKNLIINFIFAKSFIFNPSFFFYRQRCIFPLLLVLGFFSGNLISDPFL